MLFVKNYPTASLRCVYHVRDLAVPGIKESVCISVPFPISIVWLEAELHVDVFWNAAVLSICLINTRPSFIHTYWASWVCKLYISSHIHRVSLSISFSWISSPPKIIVHKAISEMKNPILKSSRSGSWEVEISHSVPPSISSEISVLLLLKFSRRPGPLKMISKRECLPNKSSSYSVVDPDDWSDFFGCSRMEVWVKGYWIAIKTIDSAASLVKSSVH